MNSVAKSTSSCTIGNTLVELPIYEESKSLSRLQPLLSGAQVAFSIHDWYMRKKKRITVPIVILTPIDVDNCGRKDMLLVSVPGYGAEIVNPRSVKPIELYRAGFTIRSAKVLTTEIKTLFK